MRLALTGHRPDKLGGYAPCAFHEQVREATRACFLAWRPVEVISGMAQGFDTIGAQLAVEIGLPLVAAIPFEGQERAWPVAARAEYERLLRAASEVVLVSPGAFAAWKYQKRNEYMVDRGTWVLACWDGSPGGTANCIQYAGRTGKGVTLL